MGGNCSKRLPYQLGVGFPMESTALTDQRPPQLRRPAITESLRPSAQGGQEHTNPQLFKGCPDAGPICFLLVQISSSFI
jgi:hypothetical protein